MATLTTPPGEALETDGATAVNEPSMEDILASIRRIIAEDQTNTLGRSGLGGLSRTARAAESAPPVTYPPEPPIAHSTAGAGEASVEPPAGHHVAPESDTPADALETHRPDEPALIDASTAALDDVPLRQAPLYDPFVAAELAAPAEAPLVDEQPLISASAGASVGSSFHALAESMLLQDKALVERLTRDELRPLLKAWLDDNLPSIVERLVRSEIERVARGGRG